MNRDPLKDLNPEDANLAKKLSEVAEQIKPNLVFESQLENQLQQLFSSNKPVKKFSFRPLIPTLGWIALAVALVVITTFMVRNLLPGLTPQPGIATEKPFEPVATDIPESFTPTAPTVDTNPPNGQSFDWRGTKLILSASLPESPENMNIFELVPEHQATLEEARALAEKFGLDDEVYKVQGQVPNTTDYFFTDGKQSLSVNSDMYFLYTADMVKAYNFFAMAKHSDAEKTIDDFLGSHGFNFHYKVEADDLFGGYVVEPLSPDGFPLRYEYYSSRPMLFTLDENGQVLRVEANLVDYVPVSDQQYNIITADEAFTRLLDANQTSGLIESAHSESKSFNEWRREYPENQSITIHGYVSSIPALDSNGQPFIQINAYTVSGNLEGLDVLKPNTFIDATGQFIIENGIRKFNIDSWMVSNLVEEGYIGTIQSDGQNIILATDSGKYVLSDIPGDLPLPFDSAYVVGTKIGDTIDWTLIDDRMGFGGVGGGGGGGGSGGGLGFYKLNLSGTPVPFPSPTPQQSGNTVGEQYIVQNGDTLIAISQAFGVSVDELMQANSIKDPGTIFVGQQLLIPGINPTPDFHRFENQRGILAVNIYKQSDGTQRAEYGLVTTDPTYPYLILQGSNLDELKNYHNRPIDIWGSTENRDANGTPIVNVEKYEIPYPDLKFQIMKGTEAKADVNGKQVLLFTSDEGKTYVQLVPNCHDTIGTESMVGSGKPSEDVLLEALEVPDLTYGDYPALCVFSASMAISPKDGQPIEMTVTADQPYVMDEPTAPENYTPPTATIEKVELMYYVTNQHWQVDHLEAGPQYIQPVWKFSGHYSNGDVFEILVQALKQEYLLPEREAYIQGG